ncbi:MAG: alkaline phosphatase family protein [Firmicutes bacterium]|nr:alkaline phosphatase family protein [Bacillota bacterium]
MKLPKVFALLAAAVLATFGSGKLTVSALAASDPPNQENGQAFSSQPFQHVYVIMMENTGSANVIGNPNLPYINQLIHDYGYDSNYFGVTHESLANYVAFITGNNWGTNSDDPTQQFNHTNLVDQLEAHHLTWKGYMESMPTVGFKGYWYPDNEPAGTPPSVTPPNALYAIKHNPFTLMTDIVNNPSRLDHVVPFSQLKTDLQSDNVPNFVWISPNVINDMHGQPPGPGATVTYNDPTQLYQAGDQFVHNTVNMIMASHSWKTSKSVIFITWDEATYPSGNPTPSELQTFTAPGPDAPVVPAGTVNGFAWPGGPYGGGQVPLIIIDSADPHHFVINTWSNHYSLLRTIEQNWHLGYLGNASDSNQVKTLPIPGEPGMASQP